MAGLVAIGAKLRDWHTAFSVMPGLVAGIHVVTGLAGCRTSTLSAAAPDAIVLGPALNVPTWMTGTSPVMTDRALITLGKVLS
jgi:hypothetical protein